MICMNYVLSMVEKSGISNMFLSAFYFCPKPSFYDSRTQIYSSLKIFVDIVSTQVTIT